MRKFTFWLLTIIACALSAYYYLDERPTSQSAVAVDLCATLGELSATPPPAAPSAPQQPDSSVDLAASTTGSVATGAVHDHGERFSSGPTSSHLFEAASLTRLPTATSADEALAAADGETACDQPPAAENDAAADVLAVKPGPDDVVDAVPATVPGPMLIVASPASPAVPWKPPTDELQTPTSLSGALEQASVQPFQQLDLVSIDERSAARLNPESAAHLSQLTEYAISLAGRGALCSARAQLIEVLRLIAQRLDAQTNKQLHSRALAQGLRSLEEANDFAYRGREFEADLQVASFVAGHDTPILKDAVPSSPLEALVAYHRYARKCLALAGGAEPVSSEALYALGRVEQELRAAPERKRKESCRAIPLFEAAILVNPQHSLAVNELGIALAQEGKLRKAAITLEHAVQIAPRVEILANLAKVYYRLGEQSKLQATQQQISQLAAAGNPQHSIRPRVAYVPPQQFAQLGRTATTARTPVANVPARPSMATAPRAAGVRSAAAKATDTSGFNFW